MYIPSFNVINVRCTSGNGNLPLCKVSWSNLVWLVSYASRIKEEGEEEGEDEEFGKLLLLI